MDLPSYRFDQSKNLYHFDQRMYIVLMERALKKEKRKVTSRVIHNFDSIMGYSYQKYSTYDYKCRYDSTLPHQQQQCRSH